MTSADSTRPAEWDAETYHRVANPHVAWGQPVLARLPLNGNETVIDAGCGTGRMTAALLDRLPEGHVIALDRSAAMLAEAERYLAPRYGERISFVQADLSVSRFGVEADHIFSTATFHWVRDHQRLFTALFHALRPGGWLVAQCGGGPNFARLRQRIADLATAAPFAEPLRGWTGPWTFATPEETTDRLDQAGFIDIETGVIPAPTTLDNAEAYREFLRTVVLGEHLARLASAADQEALLDDLTAQATHDDPPFTLDYWRLNLRARRPARAS
jgi:trans-aconitate 2-methyltransferase